MTTQRTARRYVCALLEEKHPALREAFKNQAFLIARWQQLCHGYDSMVPLGEDTLQVVLL